MFRQLLLRYVSGRARVALVAALGLLLVGAIGFLVRAEKPWSKRMVERMSAEPPRVHDFVVVGSWWAVAANAGGLAVLLITLPVWASTTSRRLTVPSRVTPARPSLRIAWWMLLGGIAVFAAIERLPRLGHSLWNDEEYSLRRYVHGYLKPDGSPGDEPQLRFRPVTWEETLFLNRGANNHVAFSVLAKTALATHHAFTGGAPSTFDERVYRAPSLVAGLTSIVLVGLFCAQIGAPWKGLGAAALVAFHPWHLRYAAEARGYALLLMFGVLSAVCLLAALDAGRWRAWLGFGVSQSLFMLSFPGALYLAVALNGAALLALAIQHLRERMWGQAVRLAVANLISIMLFLAIYAPSIPQVRAYLSRDIARGEMGVDWFRDIWAHLCLGVQWHAPGDITAHAGTSAEMVFAQSPWVWWLVTVVLPLLAILGCAAVLRRGINPTAVILAPLMAPLIAFAHTTLSGNFLFSWYVIYAVPWLVILWAMAPGAFGTRSPWRRVVAGTSAVAIVCTYFLATRTVRETLIRVPRQPMREAAAHLRPNAETAAQVTTVSIGVSGEQIKSYDPWVHPLEGDGAVAEFERLIESARTTQVPLRVYICGNEVPTREEPALVADVTATGRFVKIAHLPGFEEMYSYTLYEYRPGDAGQTLAH